MSVSYPVEFRVRAIGLVHDLLASSDPPATEFAAMKIVSSRLGVGMETLRKWVRRQEIDTGQLPGLSSDEREELQRLRKEIHELKLANEILTTASAFFASKLDQRFGK